MELEGTSGGEEGGRMTTSQSVSEAAIANRKVLPRSTHGVLIKILAADSNLASLVNGN